MSLSTPFSIIFGHHHEQIVLAVNGIGVAVISNHITPRSECPSAEQNVDGADDSHDSLADSLHSYYLLLDWFVSFFLIIV
ncbi:MAG: hypothetical protein J6V44_08140 [Methanobrevibacter sp.]|nr:hypothetical protein [Methanobrevibacter sp.]